MRANFRHLSTLSAAICFVLAAVLCLAPRLLLSLWAVGYDDAVGLVCRRCAALFAGIGVMLFRLRHAEPSPTRAAVTFGFATGCALLALLGIGEFAVGHAGPGILLAVGVELALAAAFFSA